MTVFIAQLVWREDLRGTSQQSLWGNFGASDYAAVKFDAQSQRLGWVIIQFFQSRLLR